jgi:hypothetical protein
MGYAIDSMADQLARDPQPEPLADNDSKTGRMRRELKDNGPATAKHLAEVTGLASSGLVGALLKYDLHAGRIYKMRGRYCWNPNHVPAARPPRPGAMCETLEWHEISNDDFPDADLTVLVRLRGNEEPVWLGYWDDEEWRDIDGQAVDVVRWAQLPTGGEV